MARTVAWKRSETPPNGPNVLIRSCRGSRGDGRDKNGSGMCAHDGRMESRAAARCARTSPSAAANRTEPTWPVPVSALLRSITPLTGAIEMPAGSDHLGEADGAAERTASPGQLRLRSRCGLQQVPVSSRDASWRARQRRQSQHSASVSPVNVAAAARPALNHDLGRRLAPTFMPSARAPGDDRRLLRESGSG